VGEGEALKTRDVDKGSLANPCVFLYFIEKRRSQVGKVFFHLAFPVNDLKEAKKFYVEGLGCGLGRESLSAITLELGGHQIVAHLVKEALTPQKGIYPRHFGLVFTTQEEWQALADRAREKGLRFYQQPRRRFPGTRIEHFTFFLEDPFRNLLEFKYYKNDSAIFGERDFSQVGDTEE
jgi:extradiol dioxygenase family protein